MSAQEKSTGREAIDPSTLEEPIPNLSVVRAEKEGYRDWPINPNTPYFHEQLINVAEKGLAAQAYYSRRNKTTGQPLDDIPKDIYLRLTLADKLAQINNYLEEPIFASMFGGSVELYIEDGLRSISLQKQLYEQTLPNSIRQQNPEISDEGLELKLKDLIAVPSAEDRPSPHATGGAVDVILRYRKGVKDYVADSRVLMGYEEGDTSEKRILTILSY
ncbi:MAG: hypothetical protein ACREGG_02355 [Candidatus Saccharimonadales bacterium]